jgi:hypothetical protein
VAHLRLDGQGLAEYEGAARIADQDGVGARLLQG